MDVCVEAAERRRFLLERECNQRHRIFQACVLSSATECPKQFELWASCAREAVQTNSS